MAKPKVSKSQPAVPQKPAGRLRKMKETEKTVGGDHGLCASRGLVGDLINQTEVILENLRALREYFDETYLGNDVVLRMPDPERVKARWAQPGPNGWDRN